MHVECTFLIKKAPTFFKPYLKTDASKRPQDSPLIFYFFLSRQVSKSVMQECATPSSASYFCSSTFDLYSITLYIPILYFLSPPPSSFPFPPTLDLARLIRSFPCAPIERNSFVTPCSSLYTTSISSFSPSYIPNLSRPYCPSPDLTAFIPSGSRTRTSSSPTSTLQTFWSSNR